MPARFESRELHPVPGWGHASGFIELQRARPRERLGDVLAEAQEAINRYAWAFDERRPELFDDVFTEDAVWEGLVMGETRIGPFVGRTMVVEWLARFWRYQRDQRRHIYTNFVVDRDDGEVVSAACYLLLYGSSESKSRFETAGFVRAELVRAEKRLWIRRFMAGFDSPFWSMPIEEMSPKLRELFGIAD